MYRFTLPVHKLFGHLVTFHTFYAQEAHLTTSSNHPNLDDLLSQVGAECRSGRSQPLLRSELSYILPSEKEKPPFYVIISKQSLSLRMEGANPSKHCG